MWNGTEARVAGAMRVWGKEADNVTKATDAQYKALQGLVFTLE